MKPLIHICNDSEVKLVKIVKWKGFCVYDSQMKGVLCVCVVVKLGDLLCNR